MKKKHKKYKVKMIKIKIDNKKYIKLDQYSMNVFNNKS